MFLFGILQGKRKDKLDLDRRSGIGIFCGLLFPVRLFDQENGFENARAG